MHLAGGNRVQVHCEMNNNSVYSFYLLGCLLSIIAQIQYSSAIGKYKDASGALSGTANQSLHEVVAQLNFTNGKFEWEGGSFPYDETVPEKDATAFYHKAVLVAPIVGSVLMISLVIAGVYALRQYEIPELHRERDAEAICNKCAHTRTHGLRSKLHSYVIRLFAISGHKHDAFFIQMDPKSRTENAGTRETLDARETLV